MIQNDRVLERAQNDSVENFKYVAFTMHKNIFNSPVNNLFNTAGFFVSCSFNSLT